MKFQNVDTKEHKTLMNEARMDEPRDMPVDLSDDLASLIQTLDKDDIRAVADVFHNTYDDAFCDTLDDAFKDAKKRGLTESEAERDSVDKAHDFAAQQAIAAMVSWFIEKGMLNPEEE